jgi:hypothetical protein
MHLAFKGQCRVWILHGEVQVTQVSSKGPGLAGSRYSRGFPKLMEAWLWIAVAMEKWPVHHGTPSIMFHLKQYG